MPPFLDKCYTFHFIFADLCYTFADLCYTFESVLFTWSGNVSSNITKKNMVASDANTPIRRSRNRTPPICRYFTDPFLISCPTFLLIFTVAAIFDSSGGRQGCQPFFHLIPSLADSRPIVLSFINNSPAVLYNMFSITIGSAKINIII